VPKMQIHLKEKKPIIQIKLFFWGAVKDTD
jgi:hypothetical protein